MTAPAIDAILKERGLNYGSYIRQSQITCELLATMRRYCDWENQLAPDQQESLLMFCVKCARILNGNPNYADNWRDLEGYAKLVADRLSAPEGE